MMVDFVMIGQQEYPSMSAILVVRATRIVEIESFNEAAMSNSRCSKLSGVDGVFVHFTRFARELSSLNILARS
jgi:hypothetical protein